MKDGGRNKIERRTKGRRNLGGKREKKKSSAGFKLVWSILLVFLSVKLERVGEGIGFPFLPS